MRRKKGLHFSSNKKKKLRFPSKKKKGLHFATTKKPRRSLNINIKAIAVCLVAFVFVAACAMGIKGLLSNEVSNNTKDEKNKPGILNNLTKKEEEKIETYKASFITCGDVMAHNSQLKAQYNASKNTYSFKNNYKYVKSYIEKPDLAIANLETTLCGNDIYRYSSYPTFNTPDAIADALKDAGFDLLSTINNHSFDKSSIGVERTLSTLKEKGLETVGTRQEESEDEYTIKEINNIKIGITAYSYGEIKNGSKYLNGMRVSNDKNDLMNVFDYTSSKKAFETINSTVEKFNKDTDLQVVIIHWGNEYQRTPSKFQKNLAQKLCDSGVDVIVGSHPHVVQPVEMIKSSDGKNETLVIYSLGNYISNQRRNTLNMYTEDGLMVNIDVEKKSNEDQAKVTKVTCIPTWVNKYYSYTKYKNVYEIIPIADNILEEASHVSQNYLKQSYKNTASQISTKDDRISVVKSPFEN